MTCEEIKGIVSADKTINGVVSTDGSIKGMVSADGFIRGRVNYRLCHDPISYIGEYEVDPDFVGVMLDTSDKMMLDDVTVHPIEVETVSNPAGGNTVFIGGQFNG